VKRSDKPRPVAVGEARKFQGMRDAPSLRRLRTTTRAVMCKHQQSHKATYAFGAEWSLKKTRAAWTAQCATLALSILFMAGNTDVGLTTMGLTRAPGTAPGGHFTWEDSPSPSMWAIERGDVTVPIRRKQGRLSTLGIRCGVGHHPSQSPFRARTPSPRALAAKLNYIQQTHLQRELQTTTMGSVIPTAGIGFLTGMTKLWLATIGRLGFQADIAVR